MNIKLLHLCVDNFKGLGHVNMEFGGGSCTVYGDNATGKTSIYDALLWILFDHDSRGQTNFEVKPLDAAGQIKDHGAITSVEATLSVDGHPATFRRELREIWSTRRGGTETFFDGNTSTYFVDGVPLKKNEFARRLSEIIQEDTFRLLTGVTYFCADLPWKDRRRILFDICGSMPERNILEQAPHFSALVAAAGPLSVDDLKRKLTAERKGLAGVRDDIPARLDECKKTVDDLHGIDFSALRTERDSRATERDKLAADLIKAENESLLNAKTNERDALKNQLAALETENIRFRAQQAAPNAACLQLEQERATLEDRVAAWSADLDSTRRAAADYAVEIDRCRSTWKTENAQIYSGGTCPTCGQALAGTALQAATSRFEAQKKDRLAAIVRDSEIVKGKLAHEQAQNAGLSEKIAEATRRLTELSAQFTDPGAGKTHTIADLENYATEKTRLESSIKASEAEISSLTGNSGQVCAAIRCKILTLTDEIRAISDTLSKEGVLTYAQERMGKLRAQAADTAAQMEKLDSLLSLIDEFTRYKVRFIEENVNAHFKLARFRLFTEQINGGLADCCEVTYDGIPYGSLNNGARINVGMDVIEAFSKYYAASVPLFVDNAESVTHLHGIDTQIIRLRVAEGDKELRCETWA